MNYLGWQWPFSSRVGYPRGWRMWFRSFVDKVIGKPHLKSQKPPKKKENSISAYPPPWIKTLGKNPWMERALLLPFKAHRKKFIKKACTTCEPKDFCTTGLCYLNWILDTRNRAFYRTHHLRGIHYDSTLVAGIFRDRYPSHW